MSDNASHSSTYVRPLAFNSILGPLSLTCYRPLSKISLHKGSSDVSIFTPEAVGQGHAFEALVLSI